MARIISILSGKGGVGKTFTTASLGITLARSGSKVLLIDADMGLRNLDLILGLENDCFYHIVDLAEGRCSAKDAILRVEENLDFLAASQKDTWNHIFPAAIETVLEDVEDDYDFILIDCPAGIGEGIHFALTMADISLVVEAPLWASKRNAEKVISVLPKKMIYYRLLNQFDETDLSMLSFDEAVESIDSDMLAGVVPYVKQTGKAALQGELVQDDPKHIIWEVFRLVVNTICKGKEYPLTKWKTLLHAGAEENKIVEKKSSYKGYNRPRLDWDPRRMVYKWRGRR